MDDNATLKDTPLYERLAAELIHQINIGSFQPGDRLPSVRQLNQQKHISITTILQAYQLLEDQGTIEARPQSGYYVRACPLPALRQPVSSAPDCIPELVKIDDMAMQVIRDASNPVLIPFGAAVPAPDLLPTDRLNRIMMKVASSKHPLLTSCCIPEGIIELRTQVARRAYLAGCRLSPEDFIITAGCAEAVYLSLLAVCRSGDLVAVESPTYHGIFNLLETIGLRALEIPTHPRDGMNLEALEFALENHPIRAVFITSNFSNPIGSCMSEENKRLIVEMLARREIPLIEDDIYGELSFSNQRPGVAKAYDAKGLVLLCSSYTKDISPALRIGWVSPGRYKERVHKLKLATSIGTAVLPQLTIAEFLDSGGYDHHLRRIRRAYAQKVSHMARVILGCFPEGTRVTAPTGGFILWVQLPEAIDTLELYRKAMRQGITFVPGYTFSATQKYRNFLRLNAAYMSFSAEKALERLGMLAEESNI